MEMLSVGVADADFQRKSAYLSLRLFRINFRLSSQHFSFAVCNFFQYAVNHGILGIWGRFA